MLMVAIGHQAGLAIENTTFYNAKIQAERLAAVGQTIATLSHHIKNILQGIRGGSYLIDMGLNEKDESIVRRGWTIVEKNQAKIYNLVMDMLSFSKDREPALEPTDLNETVGDVVELMQSRAEELGVQLTCKPAMTMPQVMIDPDGIHRAVLNIVTNAIDASEGAGTPASASSTSGTPKGRPPGSASPTTASALRNPRSARSSRSSPPPRARAGPAWACPSPRRSSASTAATIVVTSQPGQGSPSPSSFP